MRRTFEEAKLPGGYRELIAELKNDAKDRHVLAAAIVAGAEIILTFNVRDFPIEVLAGFGIEAQTPDEFLLRQLNRQPETMATIIREQAAATWNPALSASQVLGHLREQAPSFVERVSFHLEDLA